MDTLKDDIDHSGVDCTLQLQQINTSILNSGSGDNVLIKSFEQPRNSATLHQPSSSATLTWRSKKKALTKMNTKINCGCD